MAGNISISPNGNIRITANGNISVNCYMQLRACSTNALSSVWLPCCGGCDGIVILFSGACYYRQAGDPISTSPGVVAAGYTVISNCSDSRCGGTIIFPPPPYGACIAAPSCPGASTYTPQQLSGCTMCSGGYSLAVYDVNVPFFSSVASYSGGQTAQTIAFNPYQYGGNATGTVSMTGAGTESGVALLSNSGTVQDIAPLATLNFGASAGGYCGFPMLAIGDGTYAGVPQYFIWFVAYCPMLDSGGGIAPGCYPNIIPAGTALGTKIKLYDPVSGALAAVGVSMGSGGYLSVQAGTFSSATLETAATIGGGPIVTGITDQGTAMNYPTQTTSDAWNGYVTGFTGTACAGASSGNVLGPDATAPGNWLGDWNSYVYTASGPGIFFNKNGDSSAPSNVNMMLDTVGNNLTNRTGIYTIRANYVKQNAASAKGTWKAWSPLISPATLSVT